MNKKILTIIALIIVVIGGIFWYFSNQKEVFNKQTTFFFAASADNKVFAMYYDIDDRKIIKERILDIEGLRLMPSTFNTYNANDSVQYNRISDKILLGISNFSDYDASRLTDAPYTYAIWMTSFKDGIPEVIYSTDNRIMSWITHPYLPLIYIIREYGKSFDDIQQELLGVDITNGNVRKISDLRDTYYMELAISENGDFIYISAELEGQSILLERINTDSGEVENMNISGKGRFFDSRQVSPNEDSFVYFSGWIGDQSLHIADLATGRDEILPLPNGIESSNINILWSGDNKYFLFEVQDNEEYAPFIYSMEEKDGQIIEELRNKYPWAWAPSERYILLADLAHTEHTGLKIDLFDIIDNSVENIFSNSDFIGIQGLKIYEDQLIKIDLAGPAS